MASDALRRKRGEERRRCRSRRPTGGGAHIAEAGRADRLATPTRGTAGSIRMITEEPMRKSFVLHLAAVGILLLSAIGVADARTYSASITNALVVSGGVQSCLGGPWGTTVDNCGG